MSGGYRSIVLYSTSKVFFTASMFFSCTVSVTYVIPLPRELRPFANHVPQRTHKYDLASTGRGNNADRCQTDHGQESAQRHVQIMHISPLSNLRVPARNLLPIETLEPILGIFSPAPDTILFTEISMLEQVQDGDGGRVYADFGRSTVPGPKG